jgi:Male sterility protein
MILYTFRDSSYIYQVLNFFFIFFLKVLMEKILRTNPDVGKFYIIIKAKDEEAAKERLISEVWFFLPSTKQSQTIIFLIASVFQIGNYISNIHHLSPILFLICYLCLYNAFV